MKLKLVLGIIGAILFYGLIFLAYSQAQVFDDGKFTPEEVEWFATPFVQHCCNLGDAYTADNFFEKDGKFYAILNDGYNHYYKRQSFNAGMTVEIPEDVWMRMRDPLTPKNPTGHGVVFMNLQGTVYCYWLPELE